MSISIKDKVAIVTGANRGIGKSIVETFIEHGARKVYLAVRNPESASELKEKYGDKVVTIQADVKDTDSIRRMAEMSQDVDIVVSNAGILLPSTMFEEDTWDKLEQELDVNVFGLLRIAHAYVDILEKNKGVLVQLNSLASFKNFTGLSTYCVSKAAAYSLTQGLKNEFEEKGVRVLSVHPGPIDTDMVKSIGWEGAPPVSVVSDSIIEALEAGEFHSFPDEMAQQFQEAYQGFAKNIVEANLTD
jgi:NAD(P)-dependent dehydrogenase (short-subunit alcohol dehydrogenase family)